MSEIKSDEAVPGDVIAGRYCLVEEIGKGGVGRVFRARDDKLARDVAVKILLPHFAVQEPLRLRFAREAKVTARLVHPGAVRLYDFGSADGRLYLVMELLAGETLRRTITVKERLPPIEATEIAAQIADVLAHAHELPLVHRDLKPENIMLTETADGVVIKVLDFGMAFIANDPAAASEEMGRLTQEGISGGTPAYMAPEQIQGAELSAATDIYAFGCVLYEMLAGVLPFEGPTMRLLTKHMYQPAPDLRELCPEAPQALVEIVDRMLAKKPLDRPSAETVRTRLIALAPVLAGQRERSRGPAFLATREARMLPAPTAAPPANPATSDNLAVRVHGAVDEDLTLALAATAITIVGDDGEGSGEEVAVDVAYVADLAAVDIAGLCERSPVPVVVASATLAIDVVSELLRAGVAEIVGVPVRADELTRKLRRAVRKKR